MGKKTTTDQKAAVPAKRAAKPTAKTKTAAATIVAPPKTAAPKAAKPKTTAAKRAIKPAAPVAPVVPAYTPEDVALRAYFIAEKRQAAGLPGDSHQDWVEAERQLVAEAAGAKKPKAKSRKTSARS